MAATMTGDEFMAMCHAALGLPLDARERGGKGRRGWQVQLSERIGISTTSIAAARRKGPSPRMIAAVDALMTGVSEIGVAEDLPLLTGGWFVGEPADRKRDPATLGEAVVVHISAPRFVLHAEWRRGDYTQDGLKRLRAETTFRVQWIEQPSSRAVKLRLLAQAKKRAEDRLRESAMAAAKAIGRSKMISRARAACGLSRDDLEAMTAAGLQISRYAADPAGIRAAYDEVDRQIREILTTRDALVPSEKRAFELGRRLGTFEQQQKIYFLADAHAGAEIAQMIASRPYKLLPLAHRETARGETPEEREEREDYEELSRLNAGFYD